MNAIKFWTKNPRVATIIRPVWLSLKQGDMSVKEFEGFCGELIKRMGVDEFQLSYLHCIIFPKNPPTPTVDIMTGWRDNYPEHITEEKSASLVDEFKHSNLQATDNPWGV